MIQYHLLSCTRSKQLELPTEYIIMVEYNIILCVKIQREILTLSKIHCIAPPSVGITFCELFCEIHLSQKINF